jgi:hypothetical protein
MARWLGNRKLGLLALATVGSIVGHWLVDQRFVLPALGFGFYFIMELERHEYARGREDERKRWQRRYPDDDPDWDTLDEQDEQP